MIRPRLDSDLSDLIEAMREVHERDAYPSVWPEDPAQFLAPPDAVGAWVAETGGRVVGQVVLRSATEPPSWLEEAGLPAAGHVILSRLFVAPGGRHQGLAQGLFQTAWGAAQARGQRAVLDVHHKNHAAIRLYERQGWRRQASVSGNWTDPDGSVPLVHVYLSPALTPGQK